jgi:SAM-dependent MidA family methyltransferase
MGKTGLISFARFMELALYCPVYGYYEKETDTVGRRGDFFTSVSVGSLFGEMLGWEIADFRLRQGYGGHGGLAEGTAVTLVEAGAHDGRLARDVLTWLRTWRTELFSRLEYWIVEPSATRRARQQETLAEFSSQMRWFSSVTELAANPQSAIRNPQSFTVFFSNELLDAFPVHRLGWDAKARAWFEWGVALQDGKFVWARMNQLDPRAESWLAGGGANWRALARELAGVLPDGFTTEICPAAEQWWRDAAAVLGHGKLMTIDYGLKAEEFFAPHRSGGTLRAYHRHHLVPDPLANPGEQDLTAHVNFTALQAIGESAGLKTEALISQGEFLTQLAGRIWASPGSFAAWTPAHTREFQTLTHPDHLGRAFRVLIQSK